MEKRSFVSKTSIELLKKTIDEKWKKIVLKECADEGRINCFLCKEYHSPFTPETCCNECPIFKKTNLQHCRGTPYVDWYYHHKKDHKGSPSREILCSTCKSLAINELKFLEKFYEEIRDYSQ